MGANVWGWVGCATECGYGAAAHIACSGTNDGLVWFGSVGVFIGVPSVVVRYGFAWMIDENGNLGTVK